MRHLAGEVLSGHKPSARIEVIVSTLAGLIAAIAVTVLSSPEFGFLAGWNTATALYLAWVWMMVWPRDAKQTARWAEYTDPTRALADLLVLTAAVASLVAVGFVLAHVARSQGMWELMQVGLSLASVVLSWAVVHTVFTLRYARLYYLGPDGGVDFNDESKPRYSDFAYLAFTIGMTFQVSDTALYSNEIRRTALRHALLSICSAPASLPRRSTWWPASPVSSRGGRHLGLPARNGDGRFDLLGATRRRGWLLSWPERS